jgi:hypothetical protein
MTQDEALAGSHEAESASQAEEDTFWAEFYNQPRAPRTCEVCGRALKAAVRSHTRTCGQRCRKALSRREAKPQP